eukprot:COSAG02_NODE_3166_length_7245_cov_4.559054_6_plen_523_part_00
MDSEAGLHGFREPDAAELASTARQLREQLKEQMRFLRGEDAQFQERLSQLSAEVPSSPEGGAASSPPPMVSVPASYAVDGELLRQEAEQFARRTQSHLEDALRVRVAALTESHRHEIADMQDENARLRAVVRRMDTEMRHYQASISHSVATANARMEAMLQDERAGWERKTRALEDELHGVTATVVAQRQQLSALRGVEERGKAAEMELEALRDRLSAVQVNTRDSFNAMAEMVAKSRRAELELRQQLEADRLSKLESSSVVATIRTPLCTESPHREPSLQHPPEHDALKPNEAHGTHSRHKTEEEEEKVQQQQQQQQQQHLTPPEAVPIGNVMLNERPPQPQRLSTSTASVTTMSTLALMEAEHTQPGPERIWLSRLVAQQQGEKEEEPGDIGSAEMDRQISEPEETRSRERVEKLAILALMSASATTGSSQQGEVRTDAAVQRSLETSSVSLDVSTLDQTDDFRARSERLTVGLGDAIARAQQRADASSHLDTDSEEDMEEESSGTGGRDRSEEEDYPSD